MGPVALVNAMFFRRVKVREEGVGSTRYSSSAHSRGHVSLRGGLIMEQVEWSHRSLVGFWAFHLWYLEAGCCGRLAAACCSSDRFRVYLCWLVRVVCGAVPRVLCLHAFSGFFAGSTVFWLTIKRLCLSTTKIAGLVD